MIFVHDSPHQKQNFLNLIACHIHKPFNRLSHSSTKFWACVVIQICNFCFQNFWQNFTIFIIFCKKNSVSGACCSFNSFFNLSIFFMTTAPVHSMKMLRTTSRLRRFELWDFLGGRKEYPTVCPFYKLLTILLFCFQYTQYPNNQTQDVNCFRWNVWIKWRTINNAYSVKAKVFKYKQKNTPVT